MTICGLDGGIYRAPTFYWWPLIGGYRRPWGWLLDVWWLGWRFQVHPVYSERTER
jgi:hypothetical protein